MIACENYTTVLFRY